MTLTKHARARQRSRSISDDAVAAALEFGRMVVIRGAAIFAIGRREVERCRRDGLDIARFEGIHVVCTLDGVVLTTYRNRSLVGLRRGGS